MRLPGISVIRPLRREEEMASSSPTNPHDICFVMAAEMAPEVVFAVDIKQTTVYEAEGVLLLLQNSPLVTEVASELVRDELHPEHLCQEEFNLRSSLYAWRTACYRTQGHYHPAEFGHQREHHHPQQAQNANEAKYLPLLTTSAKGAQYCS